MWQSIPCTVTLRDVPSYLGFFGVENILASPAGEVARRRSDGGVIYLDKRK